MLRHFDKKGASVLEFMNGATLEFMSWLAAAAVRDNKVLPRQSRNISEGMYQIKVARLHIK